VTSIKLTRFQIPTHEGPTTVAQVSSESYEAWGRALSSITAGLKWNMAQSSRYLTQISARAWSHVHWHMIQRKCCFRTCSRTPACWGLKIKLRRLWCI